MNFADPDLNYFCVWKNVVGGIQSFQNVFVDPFQSLLPFLPFRILSPLSKEVSIPKCSIQTSSSYTTAPRKKKHIHQMIQLCTSNLNPQVACLRANGIHKPRQRKFGAGFSVGYTRQNQSSVFKLGMITYCSITLDSFWGKDVSLKKRWIRGSE